MKSAPTHVTQNRPCNETSSSALSRRVRLALGAGAMAILVLSSGCQGHPDNTVSSGQNKTAHQTASQQNAETLTLREGDVLKVSFPSSPNLDATQTIRRDGKIALTLIGEIQAAGLKPAELQNELLKLYAPQLVSKEILVSVVSSSITAFVTGAVLRPGKIVSDHPITALEAIMEAGGPDYAKANLKSVVVIRQEANGKTRNITVNLKQVIEGKSNEPFYLQPSDIVYVPEGFSMF